MILRKATTRRIAERVRAIRDHPAAKRFFAIAHWVLLGLIVTYLVYRLARIGVVEVIASLPASPWFYAFFFLRYLTLPMAETAAYEIVWDRPLAHHFPAFIRKRVWNYAVAGYSGEGFLTLWARRRLGLSDMRALVGVKDNSIISSLAANLATVTLVLSLALAGGLTAALNVMPGAGLLFGASFLAASVVALAVLLLRKRLIALSEEKRRKVLAIHLVRQVVTITLFAAMYAAALPEAPFGSWLLFIALQLVITRIPFLPNQDLVYLTAALSFASIIGAREEQVAGMLVAEAGLSLIVNFVLFFATVYLARRNIEPEPTPGA
jgi:hypothetical protein